MTRTWPCAMHFLLFVKELSGTQKFPKKSALQGDSRRSGYRSERRVCAVEKPTIECQGAAVGAYVKAQSALKFPRRPLPLSQDSEPCFPTWDTRERVARRAGSWFGGKPALLWSVARNAFQTPSYPVLSHAPSSEQCEHIAAFPCELRCEVCWETDSRQAVDARHALRLRPQAHLRMRRRGFKLNRTVRFLLHDGRPTGNR